MRVLTERSVIEHTADALEPPDAVLAGRGIGRPHERSNRESAGSPAAQSRQRGPAAVVQGSLDVARDDRVAFGTDHVGMFSTTRAHVLAVAAAATVTRLLVLAVERGDILTSFTEKSDDFAQTLASSGTYGFVPGIPSAYTQPLYGWFLAALYWILARDWVVVGLAQTAVAVLVALLVYEIGRRYVSPRAGLIAALLATVHPYLVWHDVHVNREILDQVVGAAVFLLALRLAERRSALLAVALGVALGAAVLGNSRLVALPLAVAAFLLWRRTRAATTALVLVAAAVTVTPWLVRNHAEVGCWALTTDARALWKANNVNTYETLRAGRWIDDVPALPGAPRLTPEFTRDIYRQTGRAVRIDECAQMRLYRHATVEFWRQHPGEKAKLMAQATWMLWSPAPTKTEGGPSASGHERARTWSELLYAVPLFVLAFVGLRFVPRALLVLSLVFLVYETLAAMVFAGATRYRVSWDFVLAVLAGAAADHLLARRASS